MENLRSIAAAALSACACSLAVHHPTPIDHALPLLAVVVTFLALLSYPSVMLGVPLLIAAEIAIPDETTRLIAFGTIMAGAFALGLRGQGAEGRGQKDDAAADLPSADRPLRPALYVVAALVVLRWIPVDNVLIGREIFLLATAVAIVYVLGRTPFAVVVAVVTVLATPAVPLRTLALPLVVLLVAAAARLFGMPRVNLVWPSTAVLVFVMLFFSWSGIVARAFPYFLRRYVPPAQRVIVAQALAPRRSTTYDVPEGARFIVVSGANVAHLRRGALLGHIEPGGMAVRVGDASDWGYLRREHFYAARNPLPNDAAGKIRDYGYQAWIDGAGRVPLPHGVHRIRVTANAALPAGASLQVEGFE